MRVIAKRTLRQFWSTYPDAEQPLRAWYADVASSTWKSPVEIKRIYATASILGDNRVVFNLKGNPYRLIVKVNYGLGIVFVRFVGTHAAYDKVDALTV